MWVLSYVFVLGYGFSSLQLHKSIYLSIYLSVYLYHVNIFAWQLAGKSEIYRLHLLSFATSNIFFLFPQDSKKYRQRWRQPSSVRTGGRWYHSYVYTYYLHMRRMSSWFLRFSWCLKLDHASLCWIFESASSVYKCHFFLTKTQVDTCYRHDS